MKELKKEIVKCSESTSLPSQPSLSGVFPPSQPSPPDVFPPSQPSPPGVFPPSQPSPPGVFPPSQPSPPGVFPPSQLPIVFGYSPLQILAAVIHLIYAYLV